MKAGEYYWIRERRIDGSSCDEWLLGEYSYESGDIPFFRVMHRMWDVPAAVIGQLVKIPEQKHKRK